MKQNISTYKENWWQEDDLFCFCDTIFFVGVFFLVTLDIFVYNLYLLTLKKYLGNKNEHINSGKELSIFVDEKLLFKKLVYKIMFCIFFRNIYQSLYIHLRFFFLFRFDIVWLIYNDEKILKIVLYDVYQFPDMKIFFFFTFCLSFVNIFFFVFLK